MAEVHHPNPQIQEVITMMEQLDTSEKHAVLLEARNQRRWAEHHKKMLEVDVIQKRLKKKEALLDSQLGLHSKSNPIAMRAKQEGFNA